MPREAQRRELPSRVAAFSGVEESKLGKSPPGADAPALGCLERVLVSGFGLGSHRLFSDLMSLHFVSQESQLDFFRLRGSLDLLSPGEGSLLLWASFHKLLLCSKDGLVLLSARVSLVSSGDLIVRNSNPTEKC